MSTTFQLLNSLGDMMGGVVVTRDEAGDALQVGRASGRRRGAECDCHSRVPLSPTSVIASSLRPPSSSIAFPSLQVPLLNWLFRDRQTD